MKRLFVLFVSLLAVALSAQTVYLTPTPSPTPKPGAKVESKSPAAKADAKAVAKKPEEKKKEPEPTIPGLTVARTSAGFLGVELVQGNFKVSFYDANKKPVAADVAMGVARWTVKYNKSGDDRALLSLSGDGLSLMGDKIVRAPYTFKLYLSLFKDQGNDAQAVESYIIDFAG